MQSKFTLCRFVFRITIANGNANHMAAHCISNSLKAPFKNPMQTKGTNCFIIRIFETLLKSLDDFKFFFSFLQP